MTREELMHFIFNAISLIGRGFLEAGSVIGSVSLIIYLLWDSKILSYLIFAALTILTILMAGSSGNILFSNETYTKTEFSAGFTYLALLALITNKWASMYGFRVIVWMIGLMIFLVLATLSYKVYQKFGVSTGIGMTKAIGLILMDISLVGIVISIKNILILLIQ